jgi:hypothetical protein
MPAFNFNMPKSSPQFSARPAQDSSSQQYTFSSPLQKMPVTPTDTPTGPSTMVSVTQQILIFTVYILFSSPNQKQELPMAAMFVNGSGQN